jgi:hypothetical protein
MFFSERLFAPSEAAKKGNVKLKPHTGLSQTESLFVEFESTLRGTKSHRLTSNLPLFDLFEVLVLQS